MIVARTEMPEGSRPSPLDPPPRHVAAPRQRHPAAGGKAPSRCAARRSAGVHFDAPALRCSQ